MHRRRSSFRKAEEGASEIIGTLLLILIVTGAAASFGLFVQQQQELAQENKAHAARIAAEDVRLLDFDLSDVEPDGAFDSITFTIVSAWTETTIIDTFQVRQRVSGADTFVFPVKFDVVHPDGTTRSIDLSKKCPADQMESGSDCMDSPGAPANRLDVPAREVLILEFDLTDPSNFAGGVKAVQSDRPTSLAFLTRLGNRISAEVMPPVVLPSFSMDPDQLTFAFDAVGSFHPAWDDEATPPVTEPGFIQIDYYIAQSDVADCQLYVADTSDILEAESNGPAHETGWYHVSVNPHAPDTGGNLVLRDESFDHDTDDDDGDPLGIEGGDDDTCVGPSTYDENSPNAFTDGDGDTTGTASTTVTYTLIVLVTDENGMVGRGSATVSPVWDGDSGA